ncbi:hypothetical protein [Altererythrobacter litoralis]|uniref:Uncharacterized protein n=1 Tax=Altererythrobacter litoralis TaxID=3113904 RepID=A0ABU7GG50_9SPHN|nr:hypothetical protein [Erythrobacteraceae bacterium 1XM1-14]
MQLIAGQPNFFNLGLSKVTFAATLARNLTPFLRRIIFVGQTAPEIVLALDLYHRL